jgi:hypothetical protein
MQAELNNLTTLGINTADIDLNMASNKDQNSNKEYLADDMPPDAQSVASKNETMFKEMMSRFEQQQVEVNTLHDQLEKA